MIKFRPKMSKNSIEKNRRFVIFWTRFLSFLSILGPIRIYRKTGPTKSTVLGPRPPPWGNSKFYRFLCFFTVLGAFNRAGKTVSQIGIYARPPQQRRFSSVGGHKLITFGFGLILGPLMLSTEAIR
jgi:hypothetical protein